MISKPRGIDPRVRSCAGLLLRLCATFAAALTLVVDLSLDPDVWSVLVTASGAVVAAAVIWLRPVRTWAPVAVAASVLVSVAMWLSPDVQTSTRSLTELCWTALLLALVVREVGRDRVIPYAAGVAAAGMLITLRAYTGQQQVFLMILMGGWLAVWLAVGLYLRGLDAERRRRTEDAKRNERVELARDLHDFVAHHITGIVVQAQAARYVSQTTEPDREAYERMFADIEHSGVEALASMRRLVGVLRSQEPAVTSHAESLDELARLVAEYDKVGPPVRLEVAPELHASGLPYAVASTVNRLVTEALTNIRKHGNGVTAVVVHVYPVDRAVRVSVTDDGTPGTRWRAPSGGFGLTGMRERVDALGGTLVAGHVPGGGWRVAAVLPLDTAAGQSRA